MKSVELLFEQGSHALVSILRSEVIVCRVPFVTLAVRSRRGAVDFDSILCGGTWVQIEVWTELLGDRAAGIWCVH